MTTSSPPWRWKQKVSCSSQSCLRHTGAKNVIATVERKDEAGTNVVMEAFITVTFGGPDSMPPSDPDFARSRADLAVRTPGGANYAVDPVTTVDVTMMKASITTFVPASSLRSNVAMTFFAPV